MNGKVVVATGATSGIGEKAVEALARAGARIFFVARDASRAEALLRRLEALAPGREHRAFPADLSLMAETARVGAEIAAAAPSIDVLINNAGAVFVDRRVTAEGLERTFAINHMAYFILTAKLLPSLRAAKAGRVVSTASRAHVRATLDFKDLQNAKSYSGLRVYSRSKLANILFTRELARRLQGGTVSANCLHPGFVASRFADEAGGWMAPVVGMVKRLVAISPDKGADTIVYLAASPEVEGVSGGYFVERRKVEASAAARDADAARRLWEISEALMARAV
jgi:NAD(P)-dependent dehydrogenase (short-subunit alcohol dehydrogenase family)